MKLCIDESGAVYPIDADGRTPMIEVPLAYSPEYVDKFAIKLPSGDASESARTFTLAVPLYWVEQAIAQAFRFDGAPITMTDVHNEPELSAVAQADASKGEDAAWEAFRLSLARRCALSNAACAIFAESLRDQLPEFVNGLIEWSVQEVRDAEEKRAGVPLPWSERTIPMRKKRGARRGNTLAYYLKVRAQRLRTGERS